MRLLIFQESTYSNGGQTKAFAPPKEKTNNDFLIYSFTMVLCDRVHNAWGENVHSQEWKKKMFVVSEIRRETSVLSPCSSSALHWKWSGVSFVFLFLIRHVFTMLKWFSFLNMISHINWFAPSLLDYTYFLFNEPQN